MRQKLLLLTFYSLDGIYSFIDKYEYDRPRLDTYKTLWPETLVVCSLTWEATVQYCKFCRTALSPNARLCACCGRAVGTTVEQPADISVLSIIKSVFPDGITAISNPSPPVQGKNEENQDTRLTTGKEDEEDEQKRRRLLGLPLRDTAAHAQQHASAHLPTRHAPVSLRIRPQPRVCYARWLTITVTSVVIVAGVISGLAFFLQPGISLKGSNVVSPGGTLHLHGTGFFPGSRVTLTLDDRVLLAVTLAVAALTPPPKCPPGMVGRPPDCSVRCPPGFVRQVDECVPLPPLRCSPGFVRQGGECVPLPPPRCPPGFGPPPECPPLPPGGPPFGPPGGPPPCSSPFDPKCQPPQ